MTVIQHRRGTTTEWAASSYILEAGEIGLDTTLMKIKIGDGTTAWSGLDFIGGADGGLLPTGGTAGQILAKDSSTDYDASWIDNYAVQIKHEVKLGEAIAKGQAVYVSSANGTNMIVSKASNATETTSSKTMGLLETGGSTNDFVKVITEGLLAGFDTSAATAGDPVWLGTSGNLLYGLANKPYAPAHLVFIGIVTRSHATQGEIFVRPQNGFEINELHDVLIDTPADNEVLAYDSTSGLWKNQTASEAGLATPSDITTAIANLVDSAPTTLDTLNELAAALGDDPSFATTVTTALGNKQPLDADLTAIAALTGTSGFLKKTAADTWTLDTNTYYLNSNPAGYTTNTGTVTSVGMTVPTGLSVTPSSITTSGTFAISLTSGYSIPTTTKQTEWDTAYTDRLKWDGGSTGLDAATARTSLGLVIGTNVQAYDADLAGIASATLSSAGFLKTNGSGTYSTVTDNSSNWNTAYGWGDHSAAGYLTTSLATSTYRPIEPTELPGSVNLDSYTTPGVYTQSTNAEAASGTNYPEASAGVLTVSANAARSEVWQTYQTLGGAGTNKVYFRAYYVTWSAWKEVVSSTFSNVLSLTNTTSSTAYTNGALVVSGGVGIAGAVNTNSTITAAGSITANGGITGAAAKNMTVASLMPSAGTASSGVGVIMTAAATGYSPPTKRPNGDNLVAGDVWISW